MEGNETTLQLSVEGMCLSGRWARSHTSFATKRSRQHLRAPEYSLEPQGHSLQILEAGVVQEHVEMELLCKDPGSIRLSLGLIEMSELDTEEGAKVFWWNGTMTVFGIGGWVNGCIIWKRHTRKDSCLALVLSPMTSFLCCRDLHG